MGVGPLTISDSDDTTLYPILLHRDAQYGDVDTNGSSGLLVSTSLKLKYLLSVRHRSTSGGRPMSRGMTIMGPPSPSPLLRRRDYDASTRDTDSLPRKSTILSDDVFVRSMDGSVYNLNYGNITLHITIYDYLSSS